MSSPNLIKIVSLGLAVSLASVTTMQVALAADVTPAFASKTISNSKIRAGIAAFEKGSFQKAAFFQKAALKSGLSKSRKQAAYTNLCAAEGVLGNLDAAKAACDSALEIAPDSWQALNNRGVISWLSGDKTGASSRFVAAANSAGGANELTAANAHIAGADQLAFAD